MVYTVIGSRRMPYDIDGTEVAYRTGSSNYSDGIATWLTSTKKTALNSENLAEVYQAEASSFTTRSMMWVFFPELREVELMGMVIQNRYGSTAFTIEVQGSTDTTDGINGTWETAAQPDGLLVMPYAVTNWRVFAKTISFSSPKKVLRIKIICSDLEHSVRALHMFGRKAAGETPDDIAILDDSLEGDPEFTALKEWGDRPEGTTVISSIRLRNESTTKIANGINVQFNHSDFALSWSQNGPWAATLDLASLGPGSISAPIYIKNELAPPLLILGPRAGRLIVGVTSWT